MYRLSEVPSCDLSPEDIVMLQGIYDKVCLVTALPKRSARSNQLARFLVEEFRLGHTDEACLLECALWFAKKPSK